MFASFFQAGFECSSHRRRDGVRLDLIRATGHDKHVLRDYRLCEKYGFHTIRDGLRWHLIERSPGTYDWSSWLPALEAAEAVGVQVIWDLFHYGAPDHVDLAGDDFARRFTDFALAAVEVQQSVSSRPPTVCPLNEINFMAWAVDEGYFPTVGPDERGWFKRQLVRTGIAAATAIRERWPNPSSVAIGRWSTWSAGISTPTINGIATARPSRWATMNIVRFPTCWSKWRSAMESP
jgi:hypothetical protein